MEGKGWRDGGDGDGATGLQSVGGGGQMFSMSLPSHIVPGKCHSALGRRRSEARLICLTAFTETLCGRIPRSLGGGSLCTLSAHQHLTHRPPPTEPTMDLIPQPHGRASFGKTITRSNSYSYAQQPAGRVEMFTLK